MITGGFVPSIPHAVCHAARAVGEARRGQGSLGGRLGERGQAGGHHVPFGAVAHQPAADRAQQLGRVASRQVLDGRVGPGRHRYLASALASRRNEAVVIDEAL
ncbi:hypothetical protein [Embleya sp. NPDC001921]